MTDLSEKLKALGVRLGARDLPAVPSRERCPIEQALVGRFKRTAFGETFLVERCYPLDHRLGRAALRIGAPVDVITAWAGEPCLARSDLGSFVFLDTETTGLAGGVGTYVFLVGLGQYTDEGFRLTQFFMRDPAEERALLAALAEVLEACNVLVTFNGKAFDVPLLKARFIASGYAPDAQVPVLSDLAHLDLLPLARRLWKDRLASRDLGSLEEHILGLRRAHHDVPGWMIPGMYFDYLRTGDARPLRNVFYHNAVDILSLAALLSHIANLLHRPLEEAAGLGVDLIAMGRLFEQLGDLKSAMALYERGLTCDPPEAVYWEAVRRLSFVRKRRGEFSAAEELWRRAARHGDLYAHVELAKLYEHRLRDFHEAMRWTQAAISSIQTMALPRATCKRRLAELEHRLNRLQRRMAA
jgi:hypothetical protein